MSSDIHSAICVARDGASVDIELIPTTASGACFPVSRFFGLALLYEAATTMVMSRGAPLWRLESQPGGPIGRAVAGDELMTLTDVETPDERLIRPRAPAERAALRARKHALVERFITDARYVSVRHWQPLLASQEPGRFVPTPHDDARYGEASERLQAIFDAAAERARPSATLRIETTGAEWVSHLDVGMSWGVCAYDDDAALLM